MPGEADCSTRPLLTDLLSRIVSTQSGDVVIDLTDTEFIDVAVIRVVATAQQLLDRQGRRLVFRSPSRLAARLIDLVGLTDSIEPRDRPRDEPGMSATDQSLTHESPPVAPLSDRFVAVVLELAPDGIAVTDERGRMVEVNRGFETLFGYPREQLLGHTVEMLLPAAMRSAHREHRHDFDEMPSARPMGTRLDLWAIHADGTTFPVKVGLSPVSTAHGLRTIMAVRPHSQRRSTDDQAARDRAVIADHDRMAVAMNDTVIRLIFSASLRLHSLIETATVREVAAIYPAIDELDTAIRDIRTVAFARALAPTFDDPTTSDPTMA